MAISKPILVLGFLLGSLIVIVGVHGEHRKPVVVVQGSVYCKSCKNTVTDSLDGASPIEGLLSSHDHLYQYIYIYMHIILINTIGT